MRAHVLEEALVDLIVCVPSRRVVFATAALLFVSTPLLADVYKWKDANGTTVYSDRAPVAPAERVAVETRPSNPEANRARLEAERGAWARADAEREARKAADAQQREALEQQRAEQCRAAQARHARFSVDGRRYRLDERGERLYYSTEEIDRERAEARKQMAEFCQPPPPPPAG